MSELLNKEEKLEKPSLLGMFTKPREQFKRIKENPQILFPFLMVTIITIFLAIITIDNMSEHLEMDLLLGENGELVNFDVFTEIIIVIIGVFTLWLTILMISAFFYVIARALKKEVEFKQLFSLFTFIIFISSVGGLINALLAFLVTGSDPEIPFTSLNIFFGEEGPLGILLSSLEFFNIWTIILYAIGLEKVAGFSKAWAWSSVIIMNLLVLVLGMISSMLGQVMGL